MPFEEALHGILLPLQERVGQLWAYRPISVAVRALRDQPDQTKLYAAMNQLPVAEFGATVVVALPAGEEHDLASLAVAYRLPGSRLSGLLPRNQRPHPSSATSVVEVAPGLDHSLLYHHTPGRTGK